MATEKQYLHFKALYEEEGERVKKLHDHAKNNLSLITLYSAFALFAFDKDKPLPLTPWQKTAFVATILCMLGSFVLSLSASNIATFERSNSAKAIIDGFGTEPPTDEDFFDERFRNTRSLAKETPQSTIARPSN